MCCSYTNRYGDLDDDEYSSVSIADEDEAYKAVNELYRNGHRRIAALISTPDDWSISQLRYRGYRRALEEHGLPFDESLVVSAGSFSIKDAYAAMKEQLNRNCDFTAVFAIADDMAIGAMKALREGGKRVPEDCSVIAIDGLTVSDYKRGDTSRHDRGPGRKQAFDAGDKAPPGRFGKGYELNLRGFCRAKMI